jgi:hypothetical protein
MSSDQDHARLIAERVARRVQGTGGRTYDSPAPPAKNGAPVREELSAIRTGLHDLESKLDRIESKIVQSPSQPSGATRARVIDFVSPGPPVVTSPTIATAAASQPMASAFVPATQSPWLRDFASVPSHPSQERFGVEEAVVSELVEFFESEKKCAVEPGGKPCDHCSMCSSRGF